ncbi:sigma factor binding protein 1, chloroplastic-like [Salvia divinorum]|uniref:Sigma factor binding protein 1, chloroplastic-like n=1 Tax=Salvia divinorum TaxID=28513 RepID=A0ABD1I792_SALDI
MDHRGHHPPPRKMISNSKKRLKVVYISSPMKVRTSQARFRALVQELTGKNSDIAPYMDSDGGALVDYRDDDGTLLPDRPSSSVSKSDYTTTTSLDNVIASQLGEIFSSEMDNVLGSYHDLIM